MKITGLAPWFGAKRTLAQKIIEQLGPHSCYWEPFCGSMAVLMGKPRASYESVNDLHRDLINLALVLQDLDKAEQLYDRASRTLFHQDLCKEAKTRIKGEFEADGDLERAYWYLVFSWFHLNGLAGTVLQATGSFCVRYSVKGGNGATRWRSVGESIPAWHKRLIGVQITRQDGVGIIERLDDAACTALYVDPPYFEAGSRYVHGFNVQDHEQLAKALKRFRRARVVVSYYAHPALARLYPDWTVINASELAVAKSLVNCGRRDQGGRKESPEVLLINGPAIGGDDGDGLF